MNRNTGITLTDVRSEAMEAIKKLKEGTMDVKTAQEVRNLLGVMVDVAKTQVEFIKSMPNSVKEKMDVYTIKAIAGTLRDRDAEYEESMHELELRKQEPYQFSKPEPS